MCGGEEKKEVENAFRVSSSRNSVEKAPSIWSKFPGWAGTKHNSLSGAGWAQLPLEHLARESVDTEQGWGSVSNEEGERDLDRQL